MPRLVLVRHGRAAAGWDSDPDPGLDEIGVAQAEAVAERLGPLGPLPLLVSPLRRTRETAAPLEARWRVSPLVERAVAEIPSPVGVPMTGRTAWLRRAMAGNWADLTEDYRAWRGALIDRVLEVDADTVIVSHFVAINAIVGVAFDDDRVVVFAPDNGSCTVVEHDGATLRVVELGGEAPESLVR